MLRESRTSIMAKRITKLIDMTNIKQNKIVGNKIS